MRRRVDPGADADVSAKAAHAVARRMRLQERMRRIGVGDDSPLPYWPARMPTDVDAETLYRRAVEYATALGRYPDDFERLFRSTRDWFVRWERERGR